jgi:hypothetical protein
MLYVHTGIENQPHASWFKRLFRTFASKYQQNLKSFYVLKPSLWLKFLIFVGQSLVDKQFYEKIVYIPKVSNLENISDALVLPEYLCYKRKESNKKEKDQQRENNQHEEAVL